MTQGVLLFAHDNEQIQYGLFAVWQALRIRKWLNKSVSIVADQTTIDRLGTHKDVFDNIFISEQLATQKKNYNGCKLTFNNIDRSSAWEITPYDETLVIDTDIAIQSNVLNTVWNNDADLLFCKTSTDAFGRALQGFDRLSITGIDFIWATEFYFKKNKTTKVFFDLCNLIKEQYNWYSHVYGVPRGYIRNDYVWSIALHQLKGDWCFPLPHNLYFTTDKDNIVSMTDTSVVMLGDQKLVCVNGSDLHIMNKFDLIEHVKKELND